MQLWPINQKGIFLVYVCARMFVSVYVCICVYMHVCMCVCICVCVCVVTYLKNTVLKNVSLSFHKNKLHQFIYAIISFIICVGTYIYRND